MGDAAGIALATLPAGLRLRDTGSHRFAFNYGPDPVTWAGREIAAADLAWWPQD